jgi:hypothetical protein
MRDGRTFLVLLVGGAMLAMAGCDGEDAPPVVQVHDEIIGPVATAMPVVEPTPSNEPSDAGSAPVYGAVDEAGYAGYAYSPLKVCKQCGCEAGTYCFGGGTGYSTFSGTCAAPGSGFGIGCQALPAACEGDAGCDCIFAGLKTQVPCYLVCAGVGDLTVYCPSP